MFKYPATDDDDDPPIFVLIPTIFTPFEISKH